MTARFPGRAWRRRALLGLPTVLGLEPRGFFIPHRYAPSLPPAGRRQPYAAAEARLAARQQDFRAVLEELASLGPDLRRIGGEGPPAPRWTQSWFPRLDAAVAYCFVRRKRPRRVLEVGSGHSTRFLARAVADGALETEISAIDPQPRADLDRLPVALRRETLQDAGLEPFAALRPGDFLMIDSSHILMPGSDVDLLLGRVLPDLPVGIWVQVHDIFLPDDYPADWSWRGYNEQLGILALLCGGGWDIAFASHYVATRMAADLARNPVSELPLPDDARESSLWLRRRAA